MEKLKVLIVDDNVICRKAAADAVQATGLGWVAHTAPNASIAMEWLEQCEIDVVLLGARMDGRSTLELLSLIKGKYPVIEIIILCNDDAASAAIAIESLESGALDFIVKPSEAGQEKMVDIIGSRLKGHLTHIRVKKYSPYSSTGSPDEYRYEVKLINTSRTAVGKPDMVVIASSTGGPAALEDIFIKLPVEFPVPLLVIQHMPPEFTRLFADAMDKKCALNIAEACDGEIIKAGRVMIAPGGKHMTVDRQTCGNVIVKLDDSPYINGVRPSADRLFGSIAEVYEGKNILAVILTGMGNDGLKGVIDMKRKCKCRCITQSEATCVVYGMPRVVNEAGLSDEAVNLKDIAGRICQIASAGTEFE